MKRPLRPEETRLWARVAATVNAAPGLAPLALGDPPDAAGIAAPAKPLAGPPVAPSKAPPKAHSHRHGAPGEIEPRRLRRLSRERESMGPRIDLHGMTQDQARAALRAFVERASADGWRSVLVITGKGSSGDGVLRRRLPDWLSEPPIRGLIAGVGEAHRRHGGKGAMYLALRRRLD